MNSNHLNRGNASVAWQGPIALACVLLAGCGAARTSYVAPVPATPSAWSLEPTADRTGAPTSDALAAWWTTFNDPLLTSLIEQAVRSNLDVRTAMSRIRQARAVLAASRSNLRPSVSTSASTTRSRSSEETGDGQTRSAYEAGFDASWEIDIFGGLRSGIDAASAEAQGREAALADVLVTLAADVASGYVDVRSAQRRLEIAKENATTQQETYDLTRFREQAGLTSALDVQQALSSLESTRAQIAALESQAARARHALAVLLARPPAALDQALERFSGIPAPPFSMAVGVPAEALRRRPDVRAAEREVAAEAARLNVQRAALYPRFTLAGSIGLQALTVAKWFVPGSSFWSATPAVSWNVFDRSQIRQNIVAQTEVERQALISYEATVLRALQEVEDALHDFVAERVRRERLQAAVGAAADAADLSLKLYTAGLRDFRDVLDAQRSLLSLQDQLASSQAQLATSLVKAYKALGGGWAAGAIP